MSQKNRCRNLIAKRNDGYKGRYISTTEGTSAEEVFEQRLVDPVDRLIPTHSLRAQHICIMEMCGN